MIVSLKRGADAARVLSELTARGLWVSEVERGGGDAASHYVIAPYSTGVDPDELMRIEGGAQGTQPKPAHPLGSRQGPRVDVAGVAIGEGAPIAWMCGPCSVESREHVREIATRIAPLGVAFLRGGAFKPRTSPYA